MTTTLSQLARELPGLEPHEVRTLAGCGLINRVHVRDVVQSDPEGRRMLQELLDCSEDRLKKALGFVDWPAARGVADAPRCPPGGILGPPPNAAPTTSTARRTASRPRHFSLVERYEPARNQGMVGTCTSFGAVSALEGQIGPIDLSEAFVYSLTKSIDGHPENEGSYVQFAMQALARWGTCLESTRPYRPDREYLVSRPSSDAFAEAESYRAQLGAPTALSATDVDAARDSLAEGLPVAIAVPIFRATLHSLRFHSEGRFLLKLGFLDRPAAWHALCLTAYCDNAWLADHGQPDEAGGGAFLVRNSWGTEWAAENPLAHALGAGGGYALMPYAYLQYCIEAYTIPVRVTRERRVAPIASPIRQTWWQATRGAVVAAARHRLDKLG